MPALVWTLAQVAVVAVLLALVVWLVLRARQNLAETLPEIRAQRELLQQEDAQTLAKIRDALPPAGRGATFTPRTYDEEDPAAVRTRELHAAADRAHKINLAAASRKGGTSLTKAAADMPDLLRDLLEEDSRR